MPFKYSLPDTGEHSKESNRFWEIISEIAEFTAIVEAQGWTTDNEEYDAKKIKDYIGSLCNNLQRIYERDYTHLPPTSGTQEISQDTAEATHVGNALDSTLELESIAKAHTPEFALGSIGALALEISNGLKKLSQPEKRVSFNTITRFLQICLEGLGLKYIEPSIDNVVGLYYEELKNLGVAAYSEYNTQNPLKLYQNLASSGGITRVTIKKEKGSPLRTYSLSEEERIMAYRELAVAGVESQEIEEFLMYLRDNYDLEGSQLMTVSNYVSNYQNHSERII